MKGYELAVILTVPADSYAEALQLGKTAIDQCKEVLMANPDGLPLSMTLETCYERDGSEEDQRVFYLHDEKRPIEVE